MIEAIQPGMYKGEMQNGAFSVNYFRQEGGFPHVLEIKTARNSACHRGVGKDFEGALACLGFEERRAVRKKLTQETDIRLMHERLSKIEQDMADYNLAIKDAGVKIKVTIGDFLQYHNKDLPLLMHITPAWRLNTQNGDLVRPWKTREDVKEPIEVWVTHRGLIEGAIVKTVRR